jgi:hypothetical protein
MSTFAYYTYFNTKQERIYFIQQNNNMRNTFLCLLLAGSATLFSCGNQSQTKSTENETGQAISEAKDYCFREVMDNDTSRVSLHVEGGKVTGDMDYIPYEKDARRGTITGVMVNDEIKAVWHYQQEGSDDSMQVAFKLTEGALKQKPSVVNQSSGREEPDTKADYTIHIPKVDCK